jgi:hypothetical protein
VADEEAFFVVVGVDEPAGDALGTVTDDFAGLWFKDIDAVDLHAQRAIHLRQERDVRLAEDDEQVTLAGILEVFGPPMLHLKSGLWAWLGYREDWDGEPSAGRVRRFSFRSAGLTVHFGYRNVRHKPQMFRAEWAGWARWNGTNYSHQAGDAAHPHWQFDVLESLKRDDASERAATFLSVLKSEEGSAEPREFRPQTLDDDDVGDMIGVQELSRIHFASAAAWWKSQPGGIHAHAPSKAEDIQVWLRETLIYLLRELGRLQAV